jgi:hypothetical protein
MYSINYELCTVHVFKDLLLLVEQLKFYLKVSRIPYTRTYTEIHGNSEY